MIVSQNSQIILTSTLIATALSICLTAFITWRFKIYDFKKDYFREIIKRRINCYENIVHFLDEFVIVSKSQDNGSSYFQCMTDLNLFKNTFSDNLDIAIKNSMWINNNTRRILLEFNSFYEEYIVILNPDNSIEENVIDNIENATKLYPKIHDLKNKLRKNVIIDLKELHKLDFSKLIDDDELLLMKKH